MAKQVRTLFKHQGKPRHFIKDWRLYRGLTQERLAERLGMTHGAVSQLERGLVGYSQDSLEALADALQCEPADLLWRHPDSEFGAILAEVSRFPPDQHKRIVAVLKAFREAA
jgi:transcriptional regulator with XRE-family HTH domain